MSTEQEADMEVNTYPLSCPFGPLARFVAETHFEHIPEGVIHEAELSVVDTLGCIVRGYCTEEGKKAVAVEKAMGGKLESTILVCGERVPAISAARANGYLGDVNEFNDLVGGPCRGWSYSSSDGCDRVAKKSWNSLSHRSGVGLRSDDPNPQYV